MSALLALALVLLPAAGRGAPRLAVMPLADLSRGANGVNLELTELLVKRLRARGFEVVPERKVVAFLVLHRIRWTGWLDRVRTAQMGRELRIEGLVLGTITEWSERPHAAVGLSLLLVDARDGRPLWARTGGLSAADLRRPLGLKAPDSPAELAARLLQELLADLPLGGWPRAAMGGAPPACEVEEAVVLPRFVRGGEAVTCRVRLRCPGTPPARVWLKVGGPEGTRLLPARRRAEGEYVASWRAPPRDGRYAVSLLAGGKGGKRSRFLCTYWVDNLPPALSLRPKRGVRVGEDLAFRRQVLFVPRLERPEPIVRWAFTVLDAKGHRLVEVFQEGGLPARMIWRGRTSGGSTVREGVFRATLRVWDRAGNEASASCRLILKRTPPRVTVRAWWTGQNRAVVELHAPPQLVPPSSWWLEILDEGDRVLARGEGDSFPARVSLPLKPGHRVRYNLEVRDPLGNVLRAKRRPLAVAERAERRRAPVEEWPGEF